MSERHAGNAGHGAADLTPREAAFAARLGTALRASKAPPEDFDSRLMRTILESGAEQGRPWWTRKRAVALSPFGGLAFAAGFAGIVALGTLAAVRKGASAPDASVATAARVDTVHLVRFVIQQAGAQRVSLAGDFNGWSRDALPLEASADGSVWSVTLPLAAGRYEYAFVVDGERWIADPQSHAVQDEFGGATSVLRLAGNGDRSM